MQRLIIRPRLLALLSLGLYSSASGLSLVLLGQESAIAARSPLTEPGVITATPLPPAREAAPEPLAVPAPAVPAPAVPAPAPAPITPPEPPKFGVYRLGPGDALSVYVQRFADFNFQAAIDPEGQITHPLLGKLTLQGLTVEQAQLRVQQAVNKYIINPIVLVALTGQRPVQVTVTGEVVRPGLYPLQQQGTKISSLLVLVGGTREGADLRSVKVKRPLGDGQFLEETIDLFTPLKEGTPLPDPKLQDGDTIVVSKLTPENAKSYDRTIISRSTLVKPKIIVRVLSYARGGLGQIQLDNGSTLVDALASSSSSPETSNLKKIVLVRFDEQAQRAVTIQVDGKKALMGDVGQNIALQDNDVLVLDRNLVGKITNALNLFTQPFRDVLGFLLFFRQLGDSATNLFGPTRR
jgi:polysaccharide biosynthesis/export protein